MSHSKETAHIATYDGITFSLWKLGLWVLLEQHGLIDIVQGEELSPDVVYTKSKLSISIAHYIILHEFSCD